MPENPSFPEKSLLPGNPSPHGGFFRVPNALIDVLLPTLKDTELRILLVVLRQTWGWADPRTGHPKARDRLTHGRLKRETGRAGEAVSAAVDALVRRGLVVAEDEEGRALATPAQRRRAGSLYFLPGPTLTGLNAPAGREPEPLIDRKTEVRKPKTTKDNSDKSCPLRKSGDAAQPWGNTAQQRPTVQKEAGESLTAEQTASVEATRRQIRARLARLKRR